MKQEYPIATDTKPPISPKLKKNPTRESLEGNTVHLLEKGKNAVTRNPNLMAATLTQGQSISRLLKSDPSLETLYTTSGNFN